MQTARQLLPAHADWSENDVFTGMAAHIKTLPAKGPAPDARYQEYILRMLEELRECFP